MVGALFSFVLSFERSDDLEVYADLKTRKRGDFISNRSLALFHKPYFFYRAAGHAERVNSDQRRRVAITPASLNHFNPSQDALLEPRLGGGRLEVYRD